jgi:hypothetical protein
MHCIVGIINCDLLFNWDEINLLKTMLNLNYFPW